MSPLAQQVCSCMRRVRAAPGDILATVASYSPPERNSGDKVATVASYSPDSRRNRPTIVSLGNSSLVTANVRWSCHDPLMCR